MLFAPRPGPERRGVCRGVVRFCALPWSPSRRVCTAGPPDHPHDHRGAACSDCSDPSCIRFPTKRRRRSAGLALAFWLLRRFGGRRLGSAATRGRQPRLGVIDQATVDGRRRLVLIRRDNVEHLLIVGGPTDVVVEQKIVRAAAPREAAPLRPPAAADTLPRAVPLGEDSMWPLQPEPASKVEPSPRVEPSLRAEPRAQRPPMAVEEPMLWPGEQPTEPEAPPAPLPSGPAARERKARTAERAPTAKMVAPETNKSIFHPARE